MLDEWYVVGEMHMDMPGANTEGQLGNIKGRPNEDDLAEIKDNVEDVLNS